MYVLICVTITILEYYFCVITGYRLVLGVGFGIIILLPAVHEARMHFWLMLSDCTVYKPLALLKFNGEAVSKV